MEVTASLCKRALRYNPETGVFIWRERPREHFKTHRSFNTWNARYAGSECFNRKNKNNGYLYGTIGGQMFLAHRVAWLWVHSRWPSMHLDHVDGNRENNSIANLREATRSQNNRNVRGYGASKFAGVSRSKSKGRWSARIRIDGVYKNLGTFDAEIDAAKAYQNAAKEADLWVRPIAPVVADMLAGELN